MKRKILLTFLIACCCLGMNAKTAKQVLDQTAKVVSNKNGVSASFKLTSTKYGSTSGTIAVKGNKFNARTADAIMWYDGKTQWSYLKKTNEVNVTTPTQAQQMALNPYTFINLYKTGYKMSMSTKDGNYVVHLTAQNQKRTVQEMYITINQTTYRPSVVKMKQGKSWSTISISNFKTSLPAGTSFSFNSKDFPSAEVIDLR